MPQVEIKNKVDDLNISSAAAPSPVTFQLANSTVLQLFIDGNGVNFNRLLSIPLSERIPALAQSFGKKHMHAVVSFMVQDFYAGINPENSLSKTADDLLTIAAEDQLSMEDLLVFFELVRAGTFNSLEGQDAGDRLMNHLETYRQWRYEAYCKIKAEQDADYKKVGAAKRSSPQPTPIHELFSEYISMTPAKKIV